MTLLITALTILFGSVTVCPVGSREWVTPIGPNDDWSRMECGYVDNPFNHVCIESFTEDSVTWAAFQGRYITAAFLTLENGQTFTHAFDPYAAPEILHTTTNGQAIETVAWCGSFRNPETLTHTLLPFFGR